MLARKAASGQKEELHLTEPLVFLNGQMLPASQAHLMIYDAGLVLGATVTEQTRTFRHQPWRLDAHLDRLFQSLNVTRISIGLTREELRAISLELIEHNSRLIDAEDDLGVIQFVTAGEYATYATGMARPARTSPTVCVHTFRLPFELWAKKMRDGVHLITPSIRQIPSESVPQHIKCRSRMHYFLGEQEVKQIDPEAWALLLDLHGNVSETNTGNFLMVEKGKIISPRSAGILPGISRSYVQELALKLGIQFEESDIHTEQEFAADEAFLSSTPYCLMPVTRINGASIGNGLPGPVFERLLRTWSAAAGVDIAQQIQKKLG